MGGYKDFNRDVKAAQLSQIDHVSNIRKGDSDGEISFLYSHTELPEPLEVLALAQEVSSYPRKPSFMVFTGSETLGKDLIETLKRTQPRLDGRPIEDVIATISQALTANLEGQPFESNNEDDFGSLSASDPDLWDEASYEDDEDLDLCADFKSNLAPEKPDLNDKESDQESRLRQRQDFRAVKDAGYQVGVYDITPNGQQLGHLFSVAIQVQHLGLSEDMLQACNIQDSEFLVLLIKFKYGYPTLSEFCMFRSGPYELATFYLGKCKAPKPSPQSVNRNLNVSLGDSNEAPIIDDEMHAFVRLHLMESIQKFLNKDFSTLLRIRRAYNCSWDGAQAHISEIERSSHLAGFGSSDMESLPQTITRDGYQSSVMAGPQSFLQDHALDDEETFSLPLVAMELALYHLTRCGQYCVNCHKKMESKYESIKPFVCTDALCMDQYFCLGIGPPIEHDILFNPYVVDLLVSFFYKALVHFAVREQPQGLRLKLPSRKGMAIDGCVDLANNKANLVYTGAEHKDDPERILHAGEKITITFRIDYQSTTERHICRVLTTQERNFTFEVLASTVVTDEKEPGKVEQVKATILPWRYSLDELGNEDASFALLCLAQTIPSILDLRQDLIQHPGKRLHECLDGEAYRLLHWIVASNRSYIVQDEPINPAQDVMKQDGTIASSSATKVSGLTSEWMQFRFVQGSPEKEDRFIKEVHAAVPPSSTSKQNPTIFAWHGSPPQNWHSIIRMGLNYDKLTHGRAYGDGVYFSPDWGVSQSYAGPGFSIGSRPGDHWPNSELGVTAGIAICEIVNAPNRFVSLSPHYVVNNIEWIQCRYLMVQTNPTPRALGNPFPGQNAGSSTQMHLGYVVQQPGRQLKASNHVQIPLAGIPEARRKVLYSSDFSETVPQRNEGNQPCEGQDIDGVLVFREEEPITRTAVKRRRQSLSDLPQKMTSAQHERKSLRPEEILGPTLKLNDLENALIPRLPAPIWQSTAPGTLKALSREVKILQKVQSTSDPASLGWYIDFNKLDNLFQWIVQLHSFDEGLPLAQDMRSMGINSIVIELRFGANFPMSPPFVRVISPRFVPFSQGGGGHVTAGGAICSEMLTNSGWSPAMSVDKVFLEVRLRISDMERPARLDKSLGYGSYGVGEAMDAYRRSAQAHGWKVPEDFTAIEQWHS